MEYEDLRKFQRLERNDVLKLVELPENFYEQANALVLKLKKNYEASGREEDLRLYNNAKRALEEVFERREQKILLKALRSVKNNEIDDSNLVGFEKKFFNDLLEMISEYRKVFSQFAEGKVLVEEKEEAMEKVKAINEGEVLNTVLVRILKDIPKFVSSDLKELGPFKANDIVRLPEKEAQILAEKQFVEII